MLVRDMTQLSSKEVDANATEPTFSPQEPPSRISQALSSLTPGLFRRGDGHSESESEAITPVDASELSSVLSSTPYVLPAPGSLSSSVAGAAHMTSMLPPSELTNFM
jgi:hypothetical protein